MAKPLEQSKIAIDYEGGFHQPRIVYADPAESTSGQLAIWWLAAIGINQRFKIRVNPFGIFGYSCGNLPHSK